MAPLKAYNSLRTADGDGFVYPVNLFACKGCQGGDRSEASSAVGGILVVSAGSSRDSSLTLEKNSAESEQSRVQLLASV